MTRFSPKLFFSTVLATGVLATGLTFTSANAGFEWRGPMAPPPPPATQPPALPPSATAAPAATDGLEPVIMWDGSTAAAPENMPSVKPDSVEAAPVTQAAATPTAETPAPEGDALNGFGSDLPLVIALRQVAPVDYQISFAEGVDPGVHVSWTGGKTWELVLGDMLKPVDLAWRLHGKTVVVGHFNDEQETAAPAQSTEPADKPVVADTLPPQNTAPAIDKSAMTDTVPAISDEASKNDIAWNAPQESAPAPAAADTAPADDRVLLGSATSDGVTTTTQDEPVQLHRTKPSLMQRLGFAENDETPVAAEKTVPAVETAPVAETVKAEEANKPAAPETAPTETAAAPASAPDAEMEQIARMEQIEKQVTLPAPAPKEAAPAAAQAPVSLLGHKPNDIIPAVETQDSAPAALVVPADNTLPPPVAPVAMTTDVTPPAPAPTAEIAASPAPAAIPATQEVAPVPLAIPAAAPASPWHAAKGQSLRAALEDWSKTAGVELYWSIDYDYNLAKDVDLGGSYDEAVGKVLDSFARVRPQPYGQLHRTQDGGRVLVIKSYDVSG
jgi:hypothetical protein